MSETTNLINKINELCSNGHSNRHSFFQLQYFVIGKEPTIQAKLHACKRELLARKDDMEAIGLAIDDVVDKLRLEEKQMSHIKSQGSVNGDEETYKIKLRQHKRQCQSLEHQMQSLSDTLRGKEDEANFIIGLYEKILAIEPEKDWDSLEVQSEYWNAKLTREIESRLMLGELPNLEDFKTVLALPPGMPIQVTTLQLIESRKQQARELLQNAEKPVVDGK